MPASLELIKHGDQGSEIFTYSIWRVLESGTGGQAFNRLSDRWPGRHESIVPAVMGVLIKKLISGIRVVTTHIHFRSGNDMRKLERRVGPSCLRVVFLLLLLSVGACATTKRTEANGMARTGRAAMEAVGRYYDETRRMPRMQLRENILKESIELEKGPCTKPDQQKQCDEGRAQIAGAYARLSSQVQRWDAGLRDRRALIREAELSYAAYEALSADDFSSRIADQSEKIAATVAKVADTTLPGGATSTIASAMATQFENRQLEKGAVYLAAIDAGVLAQLTADREAFDTLYEGYLTDYEVNTFYLLAGDFASRSELAGNVLADRKLKKGSKELLSLPAVESALIGFAVEDGRTLVADSLRAGDVAQKLLGDLVAAHAQPRSKDNVGRLNATTDSLNALVDAIAANRDTAKRELSSATITTGH